MELKASEDARGARDRVNLSFGHPIRRRFPFEKSQERRTVNKTSNVTPRSAQDHGTGGRVNLASTKVAQVHAVCSDCQAVAVTRTCPSHTPITCTILGSSRHLDKF